MVQHKATYKRTIAALLWSVMAISCQKHEIENSQDETKTVNISLDIDFDEEVDAYELTRAAHGESDEAAAFDFELVPTPKTRANTNIPDNLYNLEIRQYDTNGNYLTGIHFGATTKAIGEALTIPLKPATNCQLVIVAWGNNVDVSTTKLGTASLSAAVGIMFRLPLC